MAPDSGTLAGGDVAARITAIRDKWHTSQHPMFQAMAKGEMNLRVLAVYMAQHAKYVRHGLEAFGLLYARAPGDVRKMLVENMAEEEGLIGGHTDHGAHDHMEMIHDFCAAAGMTRDEALNVGMTAAWWGRALYYLNATRTEPVGVALAMQFTQEGQMPALNSEIVLPALEEHYGIKPADRAALFFAEHAMADVEHSTRQLDLAAKYLEGPQMLARAEHVAEQMCRLRWACTTDTWRFEQLGETEPLPPGVAA